MGPNSTRTVPRTANVYCMGMGMSIAIINKVKRCIYTIPIGVSLYMYEYCYYNAKLFTENPTGKYAASVLPIRVSARLLTCYIC